MIINGFKYCPKCKQNKLVDEFSKSKNRSNGLSSWCKECNRKHWNENADKYKERRGKYWVKYYKQNKKEIDKKNIKYNHTEKGRESNRKSIEKRKENGKIAEYYQTKEYKESRKKSDRKRRENGKESEYERNRKKIDINFKIKKNLRSRVWYAVESKGKSAHTFELLGCSLDFFKQYIEEQFETGMTWKNHGKFWHIDHIIPCFYFDLTIEENQYICFNYRNLQPLWKKDNLKKNNSVPEFVNEFVEYIKHKLNIAA